MATPSLTKHTLPGALGPLYVDVLTGDRNAPRPAVLIIHGFKGFKDWGMFPPLAGHLARAGFTVVTFNLSGSGVDDDGEFTLLDQFRANTYHRDLDDIDRMLEAVADATLGFPTPSSVGLLGHSRGGGEAILEGADPRVGAVVTWASIGTIRRWTEEEMERWRDSGVLEISNARTGQVLPIGDELRQEIEQHADGALNVVTAAARVRPPLLMLHGRDDETIPLAEARRLAAGAPEHASFVVLDDAGHTFGAVHPFQGTTPPLQEAIDRSVDWFSRYLR
jgi:pimeloyl-ACP methyl ester carboxylesterase